MKYIPIVFTFFLLVLLSACTEEYEINEMPPTTEEANINVTSSGAVNTFTFSNNSDAFIKVWDFSTGQKMKGDEVSLYVPFAGEYSVKLTVYNAGGSAEFETTFNVDQTDPEICNQELITLLTGGCDMPEGKTWVIDSATAGHFGLGPTDATAPIWYAAGALEKAGGGLYDDRYTFYLNNYQFEMEPNGEVYINGGQASNFPGAYESPVGDFTAPFEKPEITNYVLDEEGTNPTLTIAGDAFLGYFTGVRTYEILEITENTMFLKYMDNVNDFSWYIRLIREGYDPGTGGGDVDPVNLPIDFESQDINFTTFGNSTFEVVDNPDPSGINTSSRVGKTVHGNETWAGLFVDLEQPVDFAANPQLSIKLWAPVTGEFIFKFEEIDNPDNNIEVSRTVDVANEWVELNFDFTGAPDNLARLIIFPGFGTSDAESFYFDDIKIYEPPVELPITFENYAPGFEVFGGNSFSVIDNPNKSGINTSDRVGEVVHGNETWAGLFVDLDNNLDLASNPVITVKVWAPVAGDFMMKLEDLNDSNNFVEVIQPVNTTGEWVELSFDFTGEPNEYGRLVLFPGWQTSSNETYYFDDIQFGQ